ncbi:MAG TPA: CPXCG motif-containing cysteine-rich protein [Verrucomicrobiales bacterium]|nr:CPXCG motif-containing cysteine-rich protein [Verrucomicrobiales bacterium]
MTSVSVQCPVCGEVFVVLAPPEEETPADVDYDCEVCCRPMRILFTWSAEGPQAVAEPA